MASFPGSDQLPRLRPLVASLLVLGCRESLEPSETASPPPPAPPTFALEVAVRTEGVNPDPDGYTISIDNLPRTVGPQETLKVPGLAAGSHTVRIFGLTVNCRIPLGSVSNAPTPRDEAWEVERLVEAFDGVVRMDLLIQCYEVGSLQLVILGGTENGPSKFSVEMNHDPRVLSVSRGISHGVESVSAGEHYLWVRALCGFDLGRPRVAKVTIGAGLTVRDTIDVGSQPCSP